MAPTKSPVNLSVIKNCSKKLKYWITQPLAWGARRSRETLALPALSPAIVTFSGSPPKDVIYFWTHRSASIWSKIPALPGISSVSKQRNPYFKNILIPFTFIYIYIYIYNLPMGPKRYWMTTRTISFSMYLMGWYSKLCPDLKDPPWIHTMTGSLSLLSFGCIQLKWAMILFLIMKIIWL